MNTAEKVFEEVRALPEVQAREVLDFVGYLKSKLAIQSKDKSGDMSEFNQYGAAFNGEFNREECHDRKILR